jgi:hypothetical protein
MTRLRLRKMKFLAKSPQIVSCGSRTHPSSFRPHGVAARDAVVKESRGKVGYHLTSFDRVSVQTTESKCTHADKK